MKKIVMATAAVILCALVMSFEIYRSSVAVYTVSVSEQIEKSSRYGQVYLTLSGIDTKHPPAVLINGEEIKKAEGDTVAVDISGRSVIEIDTGESKNTVSVEKTEWSDSVEQLFGVNCSNQSDIYLIGIFDIKN